MTNKATVLLREGKINRKEFDDFILFEENDLGREYLKNMLMWIVTEEPDNTQPQCYALLVGEQSAWRKIKASIDKVNHLIKGIDYDNGNRNIPKPLREFTPPD